MSFAAFRYIYKCIYVRAYVIEDKIVFYDNCFYLYFLSLCKGVGNQFE
jgi:hypothetical protein